MEFVYKILLEFFRGIKMNDLLNLIKTKIPGDWKIHNPENRIELEKEVSVLFKQYQKKFHDSKFVGNGKYKGYVLTTGESTDLLHVTRTKYVSIYYTTSFSPKEPVFIHTKVYEQGFGYGFGYVNPATLGSDQWIDVTKDSEHSNKTSTSPAFQDTSSKSYYNTIKYFRDELKKYL